MDNAVLGFLNNSLW